MNPMTSSDHLVILPILLPLVASAAMLLVGERRLGLKRLIGLGTTALVLLVAFLLLRDASAASVPRIYLLGDWPAPFGITLVADRLSAMMLVLTGVLGLATLTYASARWDRAGSRFHALFLLQLMGLNGAFLTGDLFNLFVFFEVLLAASFGLLLHGAGRERVSAGLHYVSINVAGSLLFLIGASLIYGVTGTLNMADLAARVATVAPADVALLQSGLGVLAVAFLLKAAMWPLGSWLPNTYAAATPPAAAMFAILSKVGVYAVLRVLMPIEAALPLGGTWFTVGGIATAAFGTIGLLASRKLSRIAGYALIVSSGTLLATVGGSDKLLAAALFYLVGSTLGAAALYLLMELIVSGEPGARPAATPDADPVFEDEHPGLPEEDGRDPVGIVIPGTLAILGGGFMLCTLQVAGLPPLSGFIGKFAIIDALLAGRMDWAAWALVTILIVSGLAIVITASRAGADLIWTSEGAPRALRLAEAVPIGILLALSLALTVFAGPAMRYMEDTARSLQDDQPLLTLEARRR